MPNQPQKTFDVASGGSTVLYFRGHPSYDAFRVEFDSGNSASTATDVTFKVDSNDEIDEVSDAGFGAMDATVHTTTGADPSAGDHVGTDASSRVVAVEIDETGSTDNAAGTVYAHNASDPAQNAQAFANR